MLPPQSLPGRPARRACRDVTAAVFGALLPRIRGAPAAAPGGTEPPAVGAREGIIGGLDLGRFDLGLEGCWLLTATELNSRAAIDRLVQAVAS